MHAVSEDIVSEDVVVKLGEIAIHEPDVIVRNFGVEIWEIDCVSKYPDAYMVEDDEGIGVDLVASPETLKIDESKKGVHTSIRFPGSSGWHIMVEALRYTVRIAIWKDRRYENDPGAPITNELATKAWASAREHGIVPKRLGGAR